jgi:hypothetical protein
MRFYLWLAIAIVLLILLLLWLQDRVENSPAGTALPATTAPEMTAAPASLPAQVPAAVATPALMPPAAYGATPAAYRPPPSQPARSAACDALAGAAHKARVTITDCRDQDGWTVVSAWAYDRNNLGDFLDEALRVGARDMEPQQQYSQSVVQGRVTFRNTFKLKF